MYIIISQHGNYSFFQTISARSLKRQAVIPISIWKVNCSSPLYPQESNPLLQVQIFFFLMFLSTSRTRKLHEPRNAWHSSWWSFKLIVFIVSVLVPFFFPPAVIQLYGMFRFFNLHFHVSLIFYLLLLPWLRLFAVSILCKPQKNEKIATSLSWLMHHHSLKTELNNDFILLKWY